MRLQGYITQSYAADWNARPNEEQLDPSVCLRLRVFCPRPQIPAVLASALLFRPFPQHTLPPSVEGHH